MIRWRKKVEEYVELRRSLGFKLLDAHNGLIQFASFLQQSRATYITISLAMKWAQLDKNARPAEWAKRLSFVRGFARHWSARDSRTEVPPSGLLPYRLRGLAHTCTATKRSGNCSRPHDSYRLLTVCGSACGVLPILH